MVRPHYRKGPCGEEPDMDDEATKPDLFVGPCARCGRPVKNVKLIGSLILGRDCRRKMLAEGFNETVHRCPLCHHELEEEHQLRVKDDTIILEKLVRHRSLDEYDGQVSKFVPPPTEATFKLLSVEVLTKDEKREGKSDDGAATNGRNDQGRRRDGAENVSSTCGSDGQTEDAEEVHRSGSDSSEPSEDD